MNISAIIAEYNPMHLGHLYHIKKTRESTNCDGIICVMSGNFVQRGEPAIIDKWLRAKEAILNGVDLVLELPTLYSTSSSEFFSFGAVSLLDSLKGVNTLSFGSEHGDVKKLYELATIFVTEPEKYKYFLHEKLDKGLTFPKARSEALIAFLKEEKNEKDLEEIMEILQCSNNILAIEYCKSLIKLNSKIAPITFKRLGNNYNDKNITSNFPSATAIRKIIHDDFSVKELEKFLPPSTYNLILNLKENNYPFVIDSEMFKFIKYKAFQNPLQLKLIPDANEGIHNLINKALITSNDFEALLYEIKTKRYSRTRLARILCQFFIGFEAFDTNTLRKNKCPYGRVLGMNETGKKILKYIKSNSEFPIYTKLPRESFMNDVLNLEIKATKAYSSLNTKVNPLDDFYKNPIIL